LKNAWTRFEEEGIIIVLKSKTAKTPPRTRLSPDWAPRRDPETGLIVPEGRLWDFIEKIAQSRREGKNRKDGATVSTRVLRLTEVIGKTLFDSDTTADSLSEEDQTTLKQTQKRRKAMQSRSKL
jgi:Glycerol-3-phosphate acyltransferase C-terminal region